MAEESVSHPSIARPPQVNRQPETAMFDWRTFDPSSIDCAFDDVLIAELITYKNNLDRLLEHKGEYVLIKGDEVVGYYPTLDAALDAGAERFGEQPALIKEIVEKEPIYSSGGLGF
jgi:hypothetical protein